MEKPQLQATPRCKKGLRRRQGFSMYSVLFNPFNCVQSMYDCQVIYLLLRHIVITDYLNELHLCHIVTQQKTSVSNLLSMGFPTNISSFIYRPTLLYLYRPKKFMSVTLKKVKEHQGPE